MDVEDMCSYCRNKIVAQSVLGFDLCNECHTSLTQRRPTQAVPQQNGYIYLRVSTKQQDNDPLSGLFIQQRQCVEYCFDNNINCIGVYQDVHSAWNMRNGGLRGLREMLEDMGFEIYFPKKCRSKNPLVKRLRDAISSSKELLLLRTDEPEPENHVHYVLVANIDRFGRDVKNMLAIKHQLATYNTKIVSVCQRILTGTDTGDFSFHREALEAELFSMDRSIRIKSVKRAKRELGHYLGGIPPFGFAIDRTNGQRKLVRSADEQSVIQKINDLKYKGWSNDQIADSLNQENILRRQKPWRASQIAYLLNKSMGCVAGQLGALSI
jgi:DNA invertase Pin-like site-specific DNA recombinase